MKVVTQVRDIHIKAMKKALNVWVEDNVQKNVPLSRLLICEKAKHMYDHLVGVGGAASTSDASASGPSPFQACRGWFDGFKKRCGLHNVKLTGELASADHEAAETFTAQLAQLVEEKAVLPEQVFDAHPLFWKKIPFDNFHLEVREDSSGVQGCKGPGPLDQCQRGLHDSADDDVLFLKSVCSQGQKQANSAHILEYQQKGVGSCHLYGLVPLLFHPSNGEDAGRN